MYTTVNNSNLPEYLLGMQVSNTFFFQNAPYSNMISGRKKTVFKYELLVRFREAPDKKMPGLFGHCPNGGGGLDPCPNGLGHLF